MAGNIFLGLEVFFTVYQTIQENKTYSELSQLDCCSIGHSLWYKIQSTMASNESNCITTYSRLQKKKKRVWVSEFPKDDGNLLDSSHTSC